MTLSTSMQVPEPSNWKSRADILKSLKLSFIPSLEFTALTEHQLEGAAPLSIFRTDEVPTSDGNLSSPLLTSEGERHLFRKYNFLKYAAQAGIRQMRRRPSETLVQQIERQLAQAEKVRSDIVEANVRLVAAIARQYATSAEEADDFNSEGNLILVNAVEKFDYGRGFRFSTYATSSVQRHLFRVMKRRRQQKRREVLSPVEMLANVSGPVIEMPEFSPRMAQEFIGRFEECLNERERTILESRFGLDGKSSATLKTVAENVGLSKERVRQLQIGAIEKLQDLAIRLRLNPETCL